MAISLKAQQIVLKLIAWVGPLAWIGYIAFVSSSGLGPDPFDTINKRLGDSTIYLLLANLYIGLLIFFFRPLPASLRALPRVRRSIGVACFFFATLHIVAYILREGADLFHAWSEITSRTYLIAGATAWLILLVLTLTSNDFSVRKLKAPNWRKLHKLVYAALFLAALHQVLIEKANIVWAFIYFFPITILYSLRLFVSFRRESSKKTA